MDNNPILKLLFRNVLSDYHNSLNELGKTTVDELCHYKGIGPAKAITILAASESVTTPCNIIFSRGRSSSAHWFMVSFSAIFLYFSPP